MTIGPVRLFNATISLNINRLWESVMNNKVVFLSFILMLGFSGITMSQNKPFVPSEFHVPFVLENEHFRFRMLTVNDVIKDYDAVMTSIDHLQGVFGPNSGWPTKELTLEQDLIDLGWHQKEFQTRRSFTYTVVSLDESRVIGCIYIFPTDKDEFDSEITMWVRKDVLDDGLDAILFETVKNWINKDWPFRKSAYPGREISWKDWELLK